MSATYRIDVEHRPQDGQLPWWARIVRLSDESYITTRGGRTSEEVVRSAREWIAGEAAREEGISLYVDDLGHDTHSVKA